MSLFRALPVLRSAAAPRAAAASASAVPRLAAARSYSSAVDVPPTGPCFGLSEDQEAYQGAQSIGRQGRRVLTC